MIIEQHKDFLIEFNRKEVLAQTYQKTNLRKKVLLTVIPASLFPLPASAAVTTGLPDPSQIGSILNEVIQFVSISGVGIGLVWLIGSRLYYLHPSKRESQKAMDIASNSIKGITQILVMPTIIGILITLATLLLGDSPYFQIGF